MLFRKKKPETFYYPCVEIPHTQVEAYRYLDNATKKHLKIAAGRMLIVGGCFLFALAVIIGRLFDLTIINYEKRSNKTSVLPSEYAIGRHNIVDRNGIVLATTLTSWDVSANPSMVKNPEEAAHNLAMTLPDLKEKELLEKLSSDGSFRYIKRNMAPAELEAVNWLGYHFLTYEKVNKRAYPQGSLFSHILGGVNIDNIGIAGIEKAFDDTLMATDLQLSLDTSVQEMTRTNLQAGVQKYLAEGGLAIVMDVNSGEILSLVSLPDYDPELPAKPEEMKTRFNQATLGVYEFGSVFKLFNTAMALENKIIKITDVINASHPIKIGRKEITDFRGQNRPLTITEILMHSSNIGSVEIALKAGYEKQRTFLKKFNLYDKLNIPLPERGMPIYNTKEKWADIESANVAFGYGMAVTPLHLISGVAALTNGGYWRAPTFLKNGNKDKPVVQVLDSAISEQLRYMMWAVINWDPWSKNPAAAYAVGGKTGTANIKTSSGYDTKKVRTSFIGVFPVNDPKYAVLVTLISPKAIKETYSFNNAGWNAKPVGLNIIKEIAPYLNVAPVTDLDLPKYVSDSVEISLIKNGRKKK